MSTPLWARLLVRGSRLLHVLHRSQEIARDEVLFAFLRDDARHEVTVASYGEVREYVPGGTLFESGLFEWERRLLEHPVVPRSGRVLLGAAGGGRELKALAERGYEVLAFEPSDALFKAAQALGATLSGASVRKADYRDLIESERGASSVFAARELAVDLVWLGWGSLSHVLDERTRLDLLSALRRGAPKAPLLLSFHAYPSAPGAKAGGAVKLRRALRRAFALVGAPEPPSSLEFDSGSGFSWAFSREELERLFVQAGYREEMFSFEPYPHALLTPLSAD